MDKWKDSELAKMKVGGNKKAKEFLNSQEDWDPSMPLSEKYNTRAAALYRDKVDSLDDSETKSILCNLSWFIFSPLDCHRSYR